MAELLFIFDLCKSNTINHRPMHYCLLIHYLLINNKLLTHFIHFLWPSNSQVVGVSSWLHSDSLNNPKGILSCRSTINVNQTTNLVIAMGDIADRLATKPTDRRIDPAAMTEKTPKLSQEQRQIDRILKENTSRILFKQ